MISRPETARSDYVDAETYTPCTDRGASPSFPAFPTSTSLPQFRHRSPAPSSPLRQSRETATDAAGQLGLSFVRLQSPPVPELGMKDARGVRSGIGRSGSVISLSESEGGASDDWEAI
jgi:hypothetical protein